MDIIEVPKRKKSALSRFSGCGGNGLDGGDESCIIDDEVVDVGDSVRFRDLCVEVECVRDGEVEVIEMDRC